MYAVVFLNYECPDASNVCWNSGHEVFDSHDYCLRMVKAWTKSAYASYKGAYAICVVEECMRTKKIHTRIEYIHEVGGP